ncbi:hydroxyproline-rich glycoprotein family protein [Zea mays]|uniref:Hydroxyproline-rich glycoprotein family protein n=1 Tax=Zea mays TaxID=4577 RepID=A0A1D6M9S1_MAIZE|nr:hydroxyproline-rich glycoprotein family protein [Zea mays]
MASKQAAAGEALAAQINGMSRPEMYDMMSKMKTMIDHDQETVRRMLVDNPDVTRALFRAQVVLGMVKTPKTTQALDMVQPTAVPTAPSSVKTTAPDHVSLPPPPLPANQQSVAQLSAPFSSGLSNVGSTMDPPTISANPPQSAQAKGYLIHQMPSSAPQPSQHPNMALPHAPPQYSNVPSHIPIVHSQPQQPLQSPAIYNQQLQPPLPQLSRPPFPHQMHSQVPNSFGLTHANAPQHMLQQPMFHPVANPQTNFLPGQPPLPSQPPPQQLYQLTPEMEKMLVQQVLGMSAEQINMLPPEQRQQVLQLRDMLRQ